MAREKCCFIIGPMKDAELGDQARLRRLASVIQPMLEKHGYSMLTPYGLPPGQIMHEVIKRIDRSSIVIADTSDNNPNVFYELAICHALGIPTIMIREKSPKKMPFDLSAFQYTVIELDKPAEVRDSLQNAVDEILKGIKERAVPSNPVTEFYTEPLINVSPAAGLAQGYFHNFVKPAVIRLKEKELERNEHKYNIGIIENTEIINDEEKQNIRYLGKSVELRKEIKLQIIFPDRINLCSDSAISAIKEERDLVKEGVLQFERRKFTVLMLLRANQVQIIDIPKPMAVMDASISRRAHMLGSPRKDSEEWLVLERQEIDRFYFELRQWIDNDSDLDLQSRIEILRFSLTEGYDPKLDWLYPIWSRFTAKAR